MLTAYLPPVGAANCLHNTANWQVSSLMGGLCVELLYKERSVNPRDQATFGFSLHDCYPSMLIQGEPASEFVTELENAQKKLSEKEIDRLLLEAYLDTILQTT